MERLRTPALAFFSFVAVACGGDATVETADSERSSGAVDVTAVDMDIAESARVPPTEVTLLEPGTGDPVPLRFRSEVGHTARMRMVQAMTMSMKVGDNELPTMEMPPVQMDFAVTTTYVGDDGVMRHEFRVEAIEVLGDGPLVPRMAQEMAPLKDLTGWDVMDPRGRVIAAQYDLPADASPQLRRSLERMQEAMRQLMPPLPEEPVGVGAKWRAESEVQSAIDFRQISEFTLESREGDTVVITVSTDQQAEPQPMESDQPGMTAELVSFAGSATGRMAMALSDLVPESKADSSVRMQTRVTPDGQPPQDVQMSMRNLIEMTPLH